MANPVTFTMNADAFTFTQLGFVGKAGLLIHFDLRLNTGDILRADETPRPLMLDADRITGYVRSNGRMYDARPKKAPPLDVAEDGNLGVALLANDPDLDAPVTYLVSFEWFNNGRSEIIKSFVIDGLPSTSSSVNLADYAPLPGDPDDDGSPNTDPPLFAPPPRYALPLSLGSDLEVTFTYKALVVDGGGDPVLDAHGNQQFELADYPGGSSVVLEIDAWPKITSNATIVNENATCTVDKAIVDLVRSGVLWRMKLDDVVRANGRTLRSDG